MNSGWLFAASAKDMPRISRLKGDTFSISLVSLGTWKMQQRQSRKHQPLPAAESADVELEGGGGRVRDALLSAVAEAVGLRECNFDPVALRTFSIQSFTLAAFSQLGQ